MTVWHTIKGYNKNLRYETNVENGVDLPKVDSNVLVIYPEITKKEAFVKIADETGMTGTNYYDGTMWTPFDMPLFEDEI